MSIAVRFVVERDEFSECPIDSEGRDGIFLWAWHRRYRFSGTHKLCPSIERMKVRADELSIDESGWDMRGEVIMRSHELDADAVPASSCIRVYMMDHSGLAFSTSKFSCARDSGQIGFIWTNRSDVTPEQLAQRIKDYDEWQQGYFEAVLYDAADNVVDGCGGFSTEGEAIAWANKEVQS